jgi:threonyl-tRNA synthetase
MSGRVTCGAMVAKDRRAVRNAGITSELFAVDNDARPLADAVQVSQAVLGDPWSDLAARRFGHFRPPPSEPPSALGLAEASPSAGAGFRHWTPEGALVVRLVEAWMRAFATNHLWGEEIVTPSIYRWREGDELHDLAATFEDRLFVTRRGERAHILRYSADPGFFDFASTLNLRLADLPVRMWEFGTFFRRGRDGELRGIERLHEFRLLDHHTICLRDTALEEYGRLLDAQISGMRELAGPVALEFTVVREHLEECLPLVRRAAASTGSPAVVEVISGHRHYWSMKSFVYVSGPYDTCNLQLDLANPTRFGITEAAHLAVVHSTMSSVERMVLIAAAAAMRREHPVLPLWLAPTQVRVLPASPSASAEATLDALRHHMIRAEIDDRPHTLAWRIRDAAAAWVPYVAVVGDREPDVVDLRHRDGDRERLSLTELVDRLLGELSGYPRAPLPWRATRERYWRR